MDYREHVHSYKGRTSVIGDHDHQFMGVSGGPIPYRGSHVHEIWGVTTFDDGHLHAYKTQLGPAIELPGGKHTHQFRTTTNTVDRHRHLMEGSVDAIEAQYQRKG